MAGPEDLIARVAISGQDDVISSLGQIGRAGEEAFARLAESASSAAGLLAGFGIAVAGVGVAIGLLAEHGARAQQAVGDLATSTGESVENISAMQQALGSVGGNVDNLAFTMRRLASQVTRTWDEIQKSVSERANVINASQLKVQETSLSLVTAQQKLREEQQRIGGGPLPGAAPAPQSAFQAQQQQRQEAELKYQQAVQASREAQHAASEAQRNDIANVVEAIGKVIAGEETLAQTATKINPTLDNVFKGIVGNSGEAAEAIKNYTGDYLQLASASPKVLEVLQNSAKFFKNSGDSAVNAALGLREFGRGSGTIVSALQNLGSEGLEKLTERFKTLGFATTEFEEKGARQFNATLFTIQNELISLKDSISSAFQPVIGEGLKTFQQAIEDNRSKIVEFAQSIADYLKPAILDFFDIISGKEATRTGWVQGLVDGFKAIGREIGNAGKAVAAFIEGLSGKELTDTSKGDAFLQFWHKTGEEIAVVADKLKIVSDAYEKFLALIGKAGEATNKGLVAVLGESDAEKAARAARETEARAKETGAPPGTAPTVGERFGGLPGGDPATVANTSATDRNTAALDKHSSAIPRSTPTGAGPTNKFVSAPASDFGHVTAAPSGVGPTNKFVEPPTSVPSQAAIGSGASAPAALDALASSAGRAKNALDEFGKPIPGRAPSGAEGVVDIPASGIAPAVPLPQPSPVANAAQQQEAQQATTLTADFAALDDQTKSLSAGLGDSLNSVLQGLAQLGAALAAAAASVPSASQGKAEGGIVSGPGGPKDDKVPIMASAGEYVVTADGSNLHKAIAHFGGGSGGQQTFAQRTGITTNLGHIKDRVHYALGGLVEAFQRPIAHYAVGGPVQAGASVASGQRPINLFIGDEKVTGLTATDSAARSISRLAVARSVRSGGTKASWYRGS